MNPFENLPAKGTEFYHDWEHLWPESYDFREADPYTRTRVILMNGTEFENVWFSHQFFRHSVDNDLRRVLALLRRSEQQQQKAVSHLKPREESILAHTIGYEQLAVDLTAYLAKHVTDEGLKNALDFVLLEDFDHLYRYADYMELHEKQHAEDLVGGYTEIMPGRPTIAHHRHPYDSVRFPLTDKAPATVDVLAANIITAAEQQTMNFYMNVCGVYPDETGRRLYEEIGMIEEQHVSQYGSLLNPNLTWLENLLVHQYTECYLYWSCFETESTRHVRAFWEQMLEMELAHLRTAAQLLKEYENREWQQVIPDGNFPEPLMLTGNIPYVREVLKNTVNHTARREYYVPVDTLPVESDFAEYQKKVNQPVENVVSHQVIEEIIARNGRDVRFQTAEHPVPELRDRRKDNVLVGREGALAKQR